METAILEVIVMGPSELLLLTVLFVLMFAIVAHVVSAMREEIQDARFEQSMRKSTMKLAVSRSMARPRNVE